MRSFRRTTLFSMLAILVASIVVTTALSSCAAGAKSETDEFTVAGTTWYNIQGSESIGGASVSRIELEEDGTAAVGVQIVTAEGSESVEELIDGLVEEDLDYLFTEDGDWEYDGQNITLTTDDGDSLLLSLESREGTTVIVDALDEDHANCFYQEFDEARAQALEQIED